MIKLSLKQNAFHTLRHAIEHLGMAAEEDVLPSDQKWDKTGEYVVSNGGRTFWSPGLLGKRPAIYNLKFALLHLIQSCELLLKAHLVETQGPESILDSKNAQRTITIFRALTRVGADVRGLLTKEEFELLSHANDLRNQIQHHEFEFEDDRLRQLCVDFLVICSFLSQKLFGVNVAEELSYDDDAVGYLSTLGDKLSSDGRKTAGRIAADWLTQNPAEEKLLCMSCGTRAFALSKGCCMACGAEGNEEASKAADELEELFNRIAEIKAQVAKAQNKHDPR
jgi:hypothetical protein